MKRIFWDESLKVGITTIDNQHLQIVNYTNTLMDIINDKELNYKNQKIDTMLNDIKEYIQTHFNFEELLIDGTDYKLLKILKQKHSVRIKKITKLKIDFDSGEITADAMQEVLHEWILDHIKNDKTFSGSLLDNFSYNKQINSEDGHNLFSMDLTN